MGTRVVNKFSLEVAELRYLDIFKSCSVRKHPRHPLGLYVNLSAAIFVLIR